MKLSLKVISGALIAIGLSSPAAFARKPVEREPAQFNGNIGAKMGIVGSSTFDTEVLCKLSVGKINKSDGSASAQALPKEHVPLKMTKDTASSKAFIGSKQITVNKADGTSPKFLINVSSVFRQDGSGNFVAIAVTDVEKNVRTENTGVNFATITYGDYDSDKGYLTVECITNSI